MTEVPGTTRDTFTERISLDGVPVVLTDTAGVRDSTDRIESMGVERTRQAMADADLLVVVIDGSEDLRAEDLRCALSKQGVHDILLLSTRAICRLSTSWRDLDPALRQGPSTYRRSQESDWKHYVLLYWSHSDLLTRQTRVF